METTYRLLGVTLLPHLKQLIRKRLRFRRGFFHSWCARQQTFCWDISGRDTNSSFDFAIYDDRAVTDVFTQAGKYYGRKCSQPAEVAKYLHLYELLEHSAHPITLEDDRVVLINEVIALAS